MSVSGQLRSLEQIKQCSHPTYPNKANAADHC